MKKVGFIGMGQMASALAGGFIRAGKLSAENLFAFDISGEAANRFLANTGGGNKCSSNIEVVQNSDLVFLCVKPQYMAPVLEELKEVGESLSTKLIVTIAAGLPINTYKKVLGDDIRIIRVMPNTPCLVGEAASGFASGGKAAADDSALVKEWLETVGVAYEVPEHLLDAVTGLSGSGPAFVFMIIEALADGGVKAGLPRGMALALAAQTLKGSAELVLKTGEHPGALKDKVTSPAGTTIAGVAELENRGIRGAMIAAVTAAYEASARAGKR